MNQKLQTTQNVSVCLKYHATKMSRAAQIRVELHRGDLPTSHTSKVSLKYGAPRTSLIQSFDAIYFAQFLA
jgi:hypothetical protein